MSNDETNALTCSAFYLAELVGCATPDSRDSTGARFLTDAREAAVDAWDGLSFDWRDAPERRAEYARDEAVERFTSTLMGTADVWRTFVDLGAWARWDDEPATFPFAPDLSPGDLSRAATAVLDYIASGVINLVTDELARAASDDES